MSKQSNLALLLLAVVIGAASAGPTGVNSQKQCALEIQKYLPNIQVPVEAQQFVDSLNIDWKQVSGENPVDEQLFKGIEWPREACDSVMTQAERLSEEVPCSEDFELTDSEVREIVQNDAKFHSFWAANIACVMAKDNNDEDLGVSNELCISRLQSFADGVRLPYEVKRILTDLHVDWDAVLMNDDMEPIDMKLPGGRPAKCDVVKQKVGQMVAQNPCFERLHFDDDHVATMMFQHENLKWFLAANIACEMVY